MQELLEEANNHLMLGRNEKAEELYSRIIDRCNAMSCMSNAEVASDGL